MDTYQKIQLTKNTSGICFIKDSGFFCRLYNQSAYIVTKLFNHPLKLHVKTIKKLNNEIIINCGLPVKNVLTYFPNALETEWGFVLNGKFDLTDYLIWRTHIINNAKQMEYYYIDLAKHFHLTPKQIAFLLTWEQASSHIKTDNDFLAELAFNIKKFKVGYPKSI